MEKRRRGNKLLGVAGGGSLLILLLLLTVSSSTTRKRLSRDSHREYILFIHGPCRFLADAGKTQRRTSAGSLSSLSLSLSLSLFVAKGFAAAPHRTLIKP